MQTTTRASDDVSPCVGDFSMTSAPHHCPDLLAEYLLRRSRGQRLLDVPRISFSLSYSSPPPHHAPTNRLFPIPQPAKHTTNSWPELPPAASYGVGVATTNLRPWRSRRYQVYLRAHCRGEGDEEDAESIQGSLKSSSKSYLPQY